jgi:hypothetical protein
MIVTIYIPVTSKDFLSLFLSLDPEIAFSSQPNHVRCGCLPGLLKAEALCNYGVGSN